MAAAHGVFREPRPQLFEVGGRQALAAQGTGPVGGQAVDETVALGGETTRLANEVGETGGQPRYSFTSPEAPTLLVVVDPTVRLDEPHDPLLVELVERVQPRPRGEGDSRFHARIG